MILMGKIKSPIFGKKTLILLVAYIKSKKMLQNLTLFCGFFFDHVKIERLWLLCFVFS